MLYEFLTSKREEIIVRTQMMVAERSVPQVTEAELADGVPLFLEQLIEALKHPNLASGEMEASAMKHGGEMLRMGYTVSQVVYDYGNLCQAVTELAIEWNEPIALSEFQAFNTCLHDAIAHAVTEYRRLREQSASDLGTERIEALERQMLDKLGVMSFDALEGNETSFTDVATELLDRNLENLNDLIDRSLAEMAQKSIIQMADEPEAATKRKASILVVERDPHLRELEWHFLQQAGYSVEFEEDGASGLERALKRCPDLIITEILVPKVDGLTLCRQLKADSRTSNVAVLVFSVLAAAGMAREAGADAFLLKPLAEHTLVATVGQLLEARSPGIGRARHEQRS